MIEMTREQREEAERAKAEERRQRKKMHRARREAVRAQWRTEGIKLGAWRGSRAKVKASRVSTDIGRVVHLFRLPGSILSTRQMDIAMGRTSPPRL